ncbi:hypothetical protein [Sphaerospermopsis sp. LEGE 08334]|uniref:hypothetical protein n=1 Tax=Sphaerospermopsis sp. LEGE 08334 TaxID=1828651 RepID=UPI0018805A70|nr:hypothetical protein [Sphaerospermopsis sp. LEGE 08334]MBE9056190.1 hypothetical protein [Sphaerospermopsis sp. LEGE 08334]
MIISFNPAIFKTQDDDIQSILADILVELLKDNHFIDPSSIANIFFDNDNKYIFNQNKIAQSHLSDAKRQNLKDYIEKKIHQNLTKLYRNHLTHLPIGNNSGEIHPQDAYKILTERSKIIVENGINDWKFVWGICQKYSNSKIKRKSIYKLLNKAISQEMIEPDHAGGIGDVLKITERWINADRYHNIYQYKLMAIFDSDREIRNGFKTPHIDKIGFFKKREIKNIQESDYEYEPNDLIIWHILYKRKIENYIPLDILFEKAPLITQAQKSDLLSKSESDLDFIDYNKDNIGQIDIKEEFPKMFLDNFSYRLLEQRCEHHKVRIELPDGTIEEISEIEQILLKIAKII